MKTKNNKSNNLLRSFGCCAAALFALSFPQSARAQSYLIVDEHFSPYAGAYDLLTVHSMLTHFQDRFWQDRPLRNSTSEVWKRAINQLGFVVVNGFFDVTQHEVFGHGYRIRERGFDVTGYKIAPFSGWTSYQMPLSTTVGDLLAITVAGLEAEGILAQKTKFHFLCNGAIDGRMATLFTGSSLSNFWYSVGTYSGEIHGASFDPANDVSAYRNLLNAAYPQDPISTKELTLWSALSFLDPMIFYSCISFFYYIACNESWTFPMIRLSDDLSYLPNLRSEFAPYAPEIYLENYFQVGQTPLYFYLKGGKRSFGLGFVDDFIFCGPWGNVGLHFDAWAHRKFDSQRLTIEDIELRGSLSSNIEGNVIGAALSFVGTYYFSSNLGVFLELGGKTAGFLPGYPLDAAFVARIGLSLCNF